MSPFVSLTIQLRASEAMTDRRAERIAEDLAEDLSHEEAVVRVAIDEAPLPAYRDGDLEA